jgi:hypothetical protein
MFDGVQIGGIWWKEEQRGSRGGEPRLGFCGFVERDIIHHHNGLSLSKGQSSFSSQRVKSGALPVPVKMSGAASVSPIRAASNEVRGRLVPELRPGVRCPLGAYA